MTEDAARLTAWETRFAPEDVNLAKKLYEAWRQAVVDWGSKVPPTWSELCGQLGDDGPKPWLAVACEASKPHAMCGKSLSGGELIEDNCRLRQRGHTCNRILHGQNNLHYCSCRYSWPVELAEVAEVAAT